MDIHKPKPVHSLREFLSEIFVVVCGVLIAIGLEQGVESLHWAEKVREARASVHHDLTQITVFADERIARHPCARAYLDTLADAIVASPPEWRPQPTLYCGLPHESVYSAIGRPFPLEVWRSVEAEGVVSHFSEQYRTDAAFLFGFLAKADTFSREEEVLAAELDPLSKPITLTPEVKLRLLTTIARLKRLDDLGALFCGQFKGLIRKIGETPTAAELAAARAGTPFLFLAPGVLVNQALGAKR